MDKKELIKNLRLLGGLKSGGEPSRVWLKETRRMLIAEISQGERGHQHATFSARLLGVAAIMRPALRPAFSLALVLVVVLSGFSVGVSASYASMPGDALYPLKRATEGIQLALMPSSDAKARLQVDFVGRRVEEVARLMELPRAERAGRMVLAVANLRDEVAEVQSQLMDLKRTEPAAAMEVAKLVDRKAEEYHSTLRKSDWLSPLSDAAMQEAKNIVVDASVKAVSIIVEGHSNGQAALSGAEVAAKLGDKIKAVSERVDDLEQSLPLQSSAAPSAHQAKTALGQARALVASNDLSGAMVKVIEGKELVRAAEQIASAAAEAGSASSTSSANVSLPSGALTVGMSQSGAPKTVSSTPRTANPESADVSSPEPASSTDPMIK